MRLHPPRPFLLAIPLLLLACGSEPDDLAGASPELDASAGTCKSAGDCNGAAPVCDELAGNCVQCLFDTQCEGDEVCDEKQCVLPAPCETSLDCVAQTSKTICDSASGRCVECVASDDCAGTADCLSNHCEPFVPCDTSLDCPAGRVCATATGRCAQCEVKADCPDGQDCIGNECKTLVECVSDNQCTPSGQLCDKAAGYCVDCLDDDQCPPTYHCSIGACKLDICEAGATSCQSNALLSCLPSGAAWASPEPCPSRTTCKSTAGSASCLPWVCDAGLTNCDGDVLETCSSDGLSVQSTVDCAATGEHCFDGKCTDNVCAPGTTFCVGNEVRNCNAAGTAWSVTDTCTSSEYCDAATASCKPQVCEPGAPSCNGSVATVCNATGSGYEAGGTDCEAQDKTCSEGACVAVPVSNCGWSPTNNYYACGYAGTDPSGVNPIACPPNLQVNGGCGTVTQIGCCDENGDNWYCNSFFLTKEVCPEPTPPVPGVRCGSALCNTPSQQCCFESSTSAQCLASSSTCSAASTPIRCDGPEDCNGQICCGESVSGASYNVVECRASCSATDNIVFCNPQGPNVCPSGLDCQPSGVLFGYDVCK